MELRCSEVNHRVIASFRLEKTFKIMESDHNLSTAKPTTTIQNVYYYILICLFDGHMQNRLMPMYAVKGNKIPLHVDREN